MTLMQGDCLELMDSIPSKSIDLILCDLPYGTTNCKWDVVIPFDKLWTQYNRIIKDNGAIVLFSKQPFTTELIHSNLKSYKYSLIWKKDNHDNPMQAKKRFLNITEDICVFYKKQCIYNPQGIIEVNKITRQGGTSILVDNKKSRASEYKQQFTNYPKNILEFKRDKGLHPTQKPVALLEYLINTYTNEGDTVLDNCMGSGSTGIACVNTNREFIGIELDENYFNIAKERIEAS
jgi:site-specific DNA-methyltransferase (adenine-specific)